jgi:hypothetical protein
MGNWNYINCFFFFIIKMEFFQHSKSKKNLNVEEEDLVDKDKDIFDLVLSFDSLELYKDAMQNSRDLVDHYHAWECNLAKFVVPQVYDFPEFMVWCASKYIPSKRAIISTDGSVLIEVTTESIIEMLRWPLDPESEVLNEFVLAKCFRELKPDDRVVLLQSYLCKNVDVPGDNIILESSCFLKFQEKLFHDLCNFGKR